jgi:hypothetical protein
MSTHDSDASPQSAILSKPRAGLVADSAAAGLVDLHLPKLLLPPVEGHFRDVGLTANL